MGNAKLAITTGLIGISSVAAIAQDTAAKKPNIVFLFSDDHAVQAISAYGSKINQTPNIDRIAKEGALFTRNFCANSICGPSRACILTGKHSHINGFMTNHDRFDGSQVTFPKLLQKAGYTTAIYGKWHLVSTPTGFDEWMIYPGQGHYYNPDYLTPSGKKRLTGYSVELTTNLAIDFLKRQKSKDKPFLLMCQYKAPHRTWNPGPEYLHLYDDVTIPEPDTLFDDYKNRASALKKQAMEIGKHMRLGHDLKNPLQSNKDWTRMTPEQRKTYQDAYGPKNKKFAEANLSGKDLVRWKYQRYIKDYLRCVAAVDDNIGRILKYLDDNGLADNTIVVYSSDQGFYLGEHGWFDKRWMFEESFRMPLLMRWPGRIKAGTRISKLTQNIDFAPTFLEAAGVKVPKEIQGMSFCSLVQGKDVPWRNSLYYHYYEFPGAHSVAKHYGIRTERYKLIHFYENNEWNLIDLDKDPKELRSCYDDPDYKEIREQLHKQLKELKAKYKNPYDDDHPDPIRRKPSKSPRKQQKKQKKETGQGAKRPSIAA